MADAGGTGGDLPVSRPQPLESEPLGMTNSQRLATVRRCLANWIGRHTAAEAPEHASRRATRPTVFQESILIRDGYYCGRRFDAGLCEAVWFLEEDEVKISDPLGQVLGVLRGGEIDALAEPEPVRHAA